MNMVELKSVGHHIDTRTGYIYPSFADGGYQIDAGMHLEDIMDDIAWDEGLSDEDRVIVNGCPKIAMDVTDGLDVGYVLEWIENHLGDVDEYTIVSQLGRMDMTGENISSVLNQWHVMNQSLTPPTLNPELEEHMLSLVGVISFKHMSAVLSNEIVGIRSEDIANAYGIAMAICFPHGDEEDVLRAWCDLQTEIPEDQWSRIISRYYRIKASMV